MSPIRWLDNLEEAAWVGFLRTQARLMTQLDRELREQHRLSLADYDVMATLSAQPEHRLRPTELADRVVISPSTLTRRLDSMEQRGLVARRRCPEDARGVHVVLTEDGLRALRQAAPSHVDGVRRHFIDKLSRSQMESLARIGRDTLSR
ncbi:MAG TPA: MarR family transcriptional regulator [Acidimicrobiales bacterium]|nr:MarR family transcriptional regulator [Acidimicrobiales bacterium]